MMIFDTSSFCEWIEQSSTSERDIVNEIILLWKVMLFG